MYGFKGADRLLGQAGRDDLYGFEGRDDIYGQGGNDKLSGGDGMDRLLGEIGSDTLKGGNSRDYLFNGPGDDKLVGGPDESYDELYMAWSDAEGDDLFDGGKGADLYILGYQRFSDWGHATISDSDIDPMPGQSVSVGDTLDTSGAYSLRGLTITLSPGPGPEVTDSEGTNTVEWSGPGEFLRVDGGNGDDTITGDEWPNVLRGWAGTNTIDGGGGNDVVNSSDNGGSLSGGDDNDSLAGYRSAILRGDNGNDHIVVGGAAFGMPSALTSSVEGGAGDDNIEALNGSPDIIDCGDGTDTATFDADLDTLRNCE
jgi:Ca2+-binding RTX toxin-like protein